MQKKQIAKYILFFLDIGIVIAVGFFRGKLIETHHGVVLSSWDNTNAPDKSRSIHIYRAAVKLEHGEVVQVICKSICIGGQGGYC
ncbi:hypothetical protein L3V32_00625 [Vibrio sp. J2-4]|uniref:hypothetical protein n=1 Tax=Vibrio sp. J2-4 TaxID=1507977 RepID=UPI001F36CD27|nr:hypothetical protein [Vibrio sp. J2-4]MCF7475215.1 hypothetical protein [Vibrio sp. J2-4]